MEKNANLEVLDKRVQKANALIQKSCFDLTTQQQKIILYLIAQISPEDEEFKTYELRILDFAKICGLEFGGGEDYERIKEQVKRIADKSMWVLLEDGDTESLIRWIETPKIKHRSGIIELRLNEDLKPYLLQLKAHYTKYQLMYILRLRSKHSIRLYELVCSIHYDKLEPYTKVYKLERLKKLLGGQSYKEFRDFRRKVLEKAIEEVNKYTDKTVTYEPITVGRKVVEIQITVSTKDALERLQVGMEIEKELGIDL